MRLTILGGGGFRVPQVHQALLAARERIDVDELVLYDVDADRLAVMRAVLEQRAATLGRADAGRAAAGTEHSAGGGVPALRTTTDLDEAVTGADVIFSAIRVGGTAGRVADERTALGEGVLGQETVGAGGLAYALRTVPVVDHVARRIAELAPQAWTISFTNPASIVTEAMRVALGERVVGICDTPISLVRRALRALGLPPEAFDRGEAIVDYAGLNHCGWLRSIRARGGADVGGIEFLPGLLADEAAASSLEEVRLLGVDWVRASGALPNEYQYYYDHAREALGAIARAEHTRGEYLAEQQHAFYSAAAAQPEQAGQLWQQAHAEREATYMATERDTQGAGAREEEDLGGGYHEVAIDLMAALLGVEEHRMILNIGNAGPDAAPLIPGLPLGAVVEVPVLADRGGIHPLASGTPLDGDKLARVQAVKSAERLIIEAARTRSKDKAWRAFAAHPLVDSVEAAQHIVDRVWV
ncbi:6-phospho-beta-glucosidase [Bogoriella caseilytica]|uniref:6-phospho-beta-glucosidase n=1 Tax=Bogoriella caseilytica TaxID=56055 RepID=A0A3N2BFB9_9MICO|nr:6-phospho-beta-glucosidase [Bogoriella caseilytica]ROR73942.1 6-phospho-beta-glucosidase [Bogoriella caseilytica]